MGRESGTATGRGQLGIQEGARRVQAAIPLGGGDVLGLDVGAGELHGGDRHLPPRGRGHILPSAPVACAPSHFTKPPHDSLYCCLDWTGLQLQLSEAEKNSQHLLRRGKAEKGAAPGPT